MNTIKAKWYSVAEPRVLRLLTVPVWLSIYFIGVSASYLADFCSDIEMKLQYWLDDIGERRERAKADDRADS